MPFVHKRPCVVGLSMPIAVYFFRAAKVCSVSCILHCMLQNGHCGMNAHQHAVHSSRITRPLLKKNGEFVPVSWAEALNRIKEQINLIQTEHGNDAMAVYGSASITNEEAYLLGPIMDSSGPCPRRMSGRPPLLRQTYRAARCNRCISSVSRPVRTFQADRLLHL